jgi:hypothetical protein
MGSRIPELLEKGVLTYQDLNKYLLWVDRWYAGQASAIAANGTLAKNQELLRWFTHFSAAIGRTYPTKIPKTAYRIAQIENGVAQQGRSVRTQVGPRSLLSFSEERSGALNFYSKFLAEHGRKLKGHTYCLISAPVNSATYVVTYEAMLGFLMDLEKNSVDIFDSVRKEYPKFPNNQGLIWLGEAKGLRVLLTGKQAAYKEILLSFDSPVLPVEIYKVF